MDHFNNDDLEALMKEANAIVEAEYKAAGGAARTGMTLDQFVMAQHAYLSKHGFQNKGENAGTTDVPFGTHADYQQAERANISRIIKQFQAHAGTGKLVHDVSDDEAATT